MRRRWRSILTTLVFLLFFHYNNSTCTAHQSFGQKCSSQPTPEDPDCCGCNSEEFLNCSDSICGKCICIEGMYYRRAQSRCVVLHLSPGFENLSKLEELRNSSVLERCLEGPKVYGEKCSTLVSDECRICDPEKFLRCVHFDDDFEGACKCPEGMFYQRIQRKCIVYAGRSCSMNPNCIYNSECVNETCKCAKGFLLDEESGQCFLGYNATCHGDWKCHKGANLGCNKRHRWLALGPDRKKDKKVMYYGAWQCGCVYEGEYYIWSKKHETCVGLAGTSCSSNPVKKQLCARNSFCNGPTNTCMCNAGYSQNEKKQCYRMCNIDVTLNATILVTSSYLCNPEKFEICEGKLCVCETPLNYPMVLDEEVGECRMPIGSPCGPLLKHCNEEDERNFKCVEGAQCNLCGKKGKNGIGRCMVWEDNQNTPQCRDIGCSTQSNSKTIFVSMYIVSILFVRCC